MALAIRISHSGILRHELVVQEPVVILGRQDVGEAEPFHSFRCDRGEDEPPSRRVIIAGKDEAGVSRYQLRVEANPEGQGLRVANLSQTVSVYVDGAILGPGKELRVGPQCRAEFGAWMVEVGLVGEKKDRPAPVRHGKMEFFEQLPPLPTVRPIAESLPADSSVARRFSMQSLAQTLCVQPQEGSRTLRAWIQEITRILQAVAAADDYAQRAVEALCELVNLDRGALLVPAGQQWRTLARMGPGQWEPSSTLLTAAVERRCIVRYVQQPEVTGSLALLAAVVAAPVLDAESRVRAVLYGERQLRDATEEAGISDDEICLVSCLATALGAGMAREEQQRRAEEASEKFARFFTPKLARELERDPRLLEGRRAEVTILFCDIKGFSRISECIGPQQTMAWIGGVMSELGECVLAEDGVLVDIIGDELMAMWGAPVEDPDHALRACLAAQAMVQKLEQLNQQWSARLQHPFDIGIGLHSGEAFVGNTGSRQKFKYGPLGHTVNLASRVQGATRHLGVRGLITEATAAQVKGKVPLRRLTQVRVVGIERPTTLYQLGEATETWDQLRREYEQALVEFESEQFAAAAERLGDILHRFPGDIPSLILMRRTVDAMLSHGQGFQPVWQLPSK